VTTVTTRPTGKPAWSREAAIGDYGGSTDKRDSATEGTMPYAWAVYRELIAMKGSAYSSQTGTLVHCQNLAKSRLLGFTCFRVPEMLRANALPASADDGLDYWIEVLGVPRKPTDQKWQLRQRCAVHYKAVTSVTLEDIKSRLAELMGDAFVDASFSEGTSLTSPPTLTYWPGINPGDPKYDLGGGTWLSERSHLHVETQRPPGMNDADYIQLTRVQGFQYLDRALPAWCTFNIADTGGFVLDVSQLDFTGL
jgi:hypothetical protein